MKSSLRKTILKKKIGEDGMEDVPVNFLNLFKYSTKLDKLLICIGCIAALSAGWSLPIMTYLLTNAVNVFIESAVPTVYNDNNSTIKIQASEYYRITEACIYMAILGTVVFCVNYIMVSFFHRAASNQALKIKCLFMKSVLRQDIGWFDTNKTGDFALQITSNLKQIQEGIGENVAISISLFSRVFASLVLSFYYGWKLTVIVTCIMTIVLTAMTIISKLQAKATIVEKTAYCVAGSVAEEVFSSIRTVAAFGGESKEIERYNALATKTKAHGIKRGLITSIGMGVVWFAVYFTCALVFWYGVILVVEERMKKTNDFTAYNLINVFFHFMAFAVGIGQLTPYIEAINLARGAAAKVYKIIARVPPIDSDSDDGISPTSIEGDITLKDVHFRYPSRPNIKILRGFSLKIKSGETVALVGPSGCGKSTVLQLIQRYYDVESGQVKIDNTDVIKLNIGCLRGNIGLVGQEPVLFSTTIADNIRYGNSMATKMDIEQAAKAANVHDFILSLPEGYNTLVGGSGTQLSGGQKQRIAIARALVKDPKILLLDEATSALDTASECSVQKALDKARQRRTTIIVAHRLSTIRTADKIVTIADGAVKEIGTHDELMAKKGVYYQLVTTQATSSEEVPESPSVAKILHRFSNNSDDKMNSRELSSEDHFADGSSLVSMEISNEMDAINTTKPSTLTLLKFSLLEYPYIVIGGMCSFIAGSCPSLYGIIFGDILQLLSKENDEILSHIQFYSGLFIGIAFLSGISSFMQTFMFSIAGEGLTLRLRKLAFSKIVYQEMSWFDRPQHSIGALCSKLSSDTSDVQGAGGARISTILQAFSTLVTALVIGFYYNWSLGLVVLPTIPLILLATYFENIMISKRALDDKSALDEASKVAIEAIQNIRTVTSLHQQEIFYIQFKAALQSSLTKSRKNSHVRGAVYGFAESIPMLMYATSLYYGSIRVANNEMLYGDLFKVMEAVFIGSTMISQVVAFSPDYQKAKTAAARMFLLLDKKPEIDIFSTEKEKLENWSGRVEFKSIYFSYPCRPNVEVLRNLNLKIELGKTVALVGTSGCGKSTCIQLIERFYEPDKGIIDIGDTDTKSVQIASMRSQVGLVSQEPVLFNYSIAENIAYGDNSRKVPMDQITTAAKSANIHDFISALPQGYSTNVGDKGVQLSGGQKQRIAIARALVRNPKLLLLDEATSSLDAESEKIVQDALERACNDRTCIVIAHRLKTIQNADVIAVIQKGRVVERGTHQELLALRGHYYNLYCIQNRRK